MNVETPRRSLINPLLLALLILGPLLLGVTLFVLGAIVSSHQAYSDGSREYYYPPGEALWLPLQLSGCGLMLIALLFILYAVFRRR